MTAEQASKIICQRYELDLSEYEMKRMSEIIKSVSIVKKEVIIKQGEVKKDANLRDIFSYICSLHNVSPNVAKSKSRRMKHVACRVHFVRYLYLNNYVVTLKEIADFLNRDHSSVITMRDSSKVFCEIPPFNFKYKFKK